MSSQKALHSEKHSAVKAGSSNWGLLGTTFTNVSYTLFWYVEIVKYC